MRQSQRSWLILIFIVTISLLPVGCAGKRGKGGGMGGGPGGGGPGGGPCAKPPGGGPGPGAGRGANEPQANELEAPGLKERIEQNLNERNEGGRIDPLTGLPLDENDQVLDDRNNDLIEIIDPGNEEGAEEAVVPGSSFRSFDDAGQQRLDEDLEVLDPSADLTPVIRTSGVPSTHSAVFDR